MRNDEVMDQGGLGPLLVQPRGRSLSAAGRVVSGSACDMQSLQDKHRAYLQSLQERNHACKQLREADDQRRQDQMKREQGFNVCFSGANATTRKGSAKRQSSLGGVAVSGNGFHQRNGGPSPCPWRQWEERTVEIRGQSGEVYALRPSGERNTMKPFSLKDSDFLLPSSRSSPKEAEPPTSPSFAPVTSPASHAAAQAKEKALALLRAQRRAVAAGGISMEGDSLGSGSPVKLDETSIHELKEDRTLLEMALLEVVVPEEAGSEHSDQAREDGDSLADGDVELMASTNLASPASVATAPAPAVVEPVALAERIAKLPGPWQASLLRLLEEAEADVSASARSQSPQAASSASHPGSPQPALLPEPDSPRTVEAGRAEVEANQGDECAR